MKKKKRHCTTGDIMDIPEYSLQNPKRSAVIIGDSLLWWIKYVLTGCIGSIGLWGILWGLLSARIKDMWLFNKKLIKYTDNNLFLPICCIRHWKGKLELSFHVFWKTEKILTQMGLLILLVHRKLQERDREIEKEKEKLEMNCTDREIRFLDVWSTLSR